MNEKTVELVNILVAQGLLKNPKIRDVFLRVDRGKFISFANDDTSYLDKPIPIDCGQTISAPHMVAIMTELLDLKGKENILEIGTGSGYQSAIIATISKDIKITTIERHKNLANESEERLKRMGYDNVRVIYGDGSRGWENEAPYDRILVTCACKNVPQALNEQLKVGGMMIAPIGSREYQNLLVFEKVDEGNIVAKNMGGCVFVPLIGQSGWDIP